MVESPSPSEALRFRTRSGGEIALFDTGFQHPTSRWFPSRSRFTPYRELTHVAVTARGLAIGTTRGTWVILARQLATPSELEAIAAMLRDRVRELPTGEERLRRMRALDERMETAARPLLGGVLAGIIIGIAAAAWVWPTLAAEFIFAASHAEAGEAWRFVTLHGLHLDLVHLGLNAVALWVLGDLLESCIGRGRAGLVAALSAAGAAIGCAWAAYPDALGASGIVSGFAGALLVLELQAPATLPAPWRLPRRVFVVAVVLDLGLVSLLPGIAQAAHLGGFIAGAVAGRALAPPVGGSRDASWGVRFANGLAIAIAALAFAQGTASALDFENTWHQRGQRLLADAHQDPESLNEAAWRIAISEAPSPSLLELAATLAERAVEETQGLRTHILDTLAEVYFLQDRVDEALDVNADALRIDPADSYLREQRRRYRGERARDDRPEPGEAPRNELPLPDEPGIRV